MCLHVAIPVGFLAGTRLVLFLLVPWNADVIPAHPSLTWEQAQGADPALDGELMVGVDTAGAVVPEPDLPVPVTTDDHVTGGGGGGGGGCQQRTCS